MDRDRRKKVFHCIQFLVGFLLGVFITSLTLHYLEVWPLKHEVYQLRMVLVKHHLAEWTVEEGRCTSFKLKPEQEAEK